MTRVAGDLEQLMLRTARTRARAHTHTHTHRLLGDQGRFTYNVTHVTHCQSRNHLSQFAILTFPISSLFLSTHGSQTSQPTPFLRSCFHYFFVRCLQFQALQLKGPLARYQTKSKNLIISSEVLAHTGFRFSRFLSAAAGRHVRIMSSS